MPNNETDTTKALEEKKHRENVLLYAIAGVTLLVAALVMVIMFSEDDGDKKNKPATSTIVTTTPEHAPVPVPAPTSLGSGLDILTAADKTACEIAQPDPQGRKPETLAKLLEIRNKVSTNLRGSIDMAAAAAYHLTPAGQVELRSAIENWSTDAEVARNIALENAKYTEEYRYQMNRTAEYCEGRNETNR